MKNRIYTVYEYRTNYTKNDGTGGRYFMDIHGVPEKIEISAEQFLAMICNAAEIDYCLKTEVSNPTDVPFDGKCPWMRYYVIG